MLLAHQYLRQLPEDVRHAVLGNAGTLIAFRLGPRDAEFIAKEFEPKLGAPGILTIPNCHVYLKLMIDGALSRPFSAVTLTPQAALETLPRSNRFG